jgi:hypothetical protein
MGETSTSTESIVSHALFPLVGVLAALAIDTSLTLITPWSPATFWLPPLSNSFVLIAGTFPIANSVGLNLVVGLYLLRFVRGGPNV